jgi:hypothetical protein
VATTLENLERIEAHLQRAKEQADADPAWLTAERREVFRQIRAVIGDLYQLDALDTVADRLGDDG